MSTKHLLLSVATIGTLIGSAAPPTCLAAPTWPQEQADKQDSVSPQPLFSPDLALLQPKTRQEHEQADLRGPCFAHYQSRGRELVFLGTQHGTRLDSPSHQLIKQVVDRFRPDCIVIEGSETRMGWSHIGLLQDAKRMVKRGACPEPLYTATLAAQREIAFLGGEPAAHATSEALRKLGSDCDALAWLVVRQLGQVRREQGLNQLDAHVEELLPRLKRRFELETQMSLVDFKNWFREQTGKPLTAENIRFARTAPLAGPAPTFFERAAVEVMMAREKHLLELQAKLLQHHKRVLVVYGNGHLVYELPVLSAMMGRPTRIDRQW